MGFLGLLLDCEEGRKEAWSCYQDLGSQRLDRVVKVLCAPGECDQRAGPGLNENRARVGLAQS